MENTLLGFFNLPMKDSQANVRLLHTSVSTIEHQNIHLLQVGDKKKSVKCVGQNCPMCANGIQVNDRIYIHLWDYTDNKEKVWSRTDKILTQLQEIENAWGDLSEIILNIRREADQFPTYAVNVIPAKNFTSVPKELVDQKISFRCYMTRSEDELNEFFRTGVMPEHKKKEFVPKEQYRAQKQAQKPQYAPIPQNVPQYTPVQPSYTGTPTQQTYTTTAEQHPVTNPFGNQPQQGYVDPFANLINRKV